MGAVFLTDIQNVNIEYMILNEMENVKGLVDNLLKLGAEVKIFDSDEYDEGIFDYQEIFYR